MTDTQFETLRKRIDRTLRNYLIGISTVFLAFFGWLTIDHLKLKDSLKDMEKDEAVFQSDFGMSQGQSYFYHPGDLVFRSNYEKYTKRRGGTK